MTWQKERPMIGKNRGLKAAMASGFGMETTVLKFYVGLLVNKVQIHSHYYAVCPDVKRKLGERKLKEKI